MDLGDMLVFVSFIAIICLRPDIVLFSTSIKTHHLGINLILQGKYGGVAPKEILLSAMFFLTSDSNCIALTH